MLLSVLSGFVFFTYGLGEEEGPKSALQPYCSYGHLLLYQSAELAIHSCLLSYFASLPSLLI